MMPEDDAVDALERGVKALVADLGAMKGLNGSAYETVCVALRTLASRYAGCARVSRRMVAQVYGLPDLILGIVDRYGPAVGPVLVNKAAELDDLIIACFVDMPGQEATSVSNSAILFRSTKDEYGFLSNFSPHSIELKGKVWPTAEHYFQAQKFSGTPYEDVIRTASSPMIAARLGRTRQIQIRRDWESVKDTVMYEAVLAKFRQHPSLREKLLATGDALLVEHSKRDRYWGNGGDGLGKNRLGQILMQVREELQSKPRARATR